MDVHSSEQLATTDGGLGYLTSERGLPVFMVRRSAELNEVLGELVTLGVQRLGYFFRFSSDCGVTWEHTSRGIARGRKSDWPAIKRARQRLAFVLQDAIEQAFQHLVQDWQELQYSCECKWNRNSGLWQLSGSGTVYTIDPELWDIGISLE
jgi:hypothetical protein